MAETKRNAVHLTQAQLYALADFMSVCGPQSEIMIEEVHEENGSGAHTKTVYGTFKYKTSVVARSGRLYEHVYKSKSKRNSYKPERISQADHQMFGNGN